MRDYLRAFTQAADIPGQLAHIHALQHYILNQLETLEANMATQDDINKIADQITTAVNDLTNEIANLKAAHPDIDLAPLETAVTKLSDLDTANAATTTPAAPASPTPSPVSDTPAPAEQAPAPENAGTINDTATPGATA